MKKVIYILTFFITISSFSQAFKDGEKLKYRLSYSKFLTAGFATMDVKKETKNDKEAFHIIGKGKTTGMISWFFKVKDKYETSFFKDTSLPYNFKRKIDEGGYTKNKEIFFDQQYNNALVLDYKHDTKKNFKTTGDVQDILSALYYMRNRDITNFKVGEEIVLKIFMDEETFDMKLRFLGRETLRTKFGKIKAAKFRPIVQAGRVFKEKESVTVWVSDDKNKIPLRIKASLSVGSLRADLHSYKGLVSALKTH
jgi:hypothetical protein